jgi:hypothetical protein
MPTPNAVVRQQSLKKNVCLQGKCFWVPSWFHEPSQMLYQMGRKGKRERKTNSLRLCASEKPNPPPLCRIRGIIQDNLCPHHMSRLALDASQINHSSGK